MYADRKKGYGVFGQLLLGSLTDYNVHYKCFEYFCSAEISLLEDWYNLILLYFRLALHIGNDWLSTNRLANRLS